MNREGKTRSSCQRSEPSFREVFAIEWVWVKRCWNLLWLIPDLALFLAALALFSAYLPDLIERAEEYGHQEWSKRLLQTAATAVSSAALIFLAWKGGKFLCAFNWRRRAREISPLSLVKSGVLIGAVMALHFTGASRILADHLGISLRPSKIIAAKLCGSHANTATQRPPIIDVAAPVIESVYRELTNTAEKRNALARAFQKVRDRYSWISLAARLYNLPTGLVVAVVIAESNGDERAVSPKGAKGLMQLMPVNYAGQNPFEPVANVESGAGMLRRLIDEHGDIATALAYYNASHRANEHARRLAEALGANGFWQRREFLPEETSDYVPKVLAIKIAWEDWERHGRVRSFEDRHGLKTTVAQKASVPQKTPRQNAQPYRQYYVVKHGDTVYSIALKTGTRPEKFRRANPAISPKRLQIGQILRLPPSDS